MANTEREIVESGILTRQITVKRPAEDMVGIIIRAQAQLPNRLILAEWQDRGRTVVTYTINPRIPRSTREIRKLSRAVGGVNRLTVKEILPFKI